MKAALASILFLTSLASGQDDCNSSPSTDEKQAAEQAQALEQAHNQIGMPAISDFQEKRMMKDLYEQRDKPIATHTYLVNEMAGCLVYIGASVGYGLPYGTQYTSPNRIQRSMERNTYYRDQVSQAEPNGLFMPPTADGTWVLMKVPNEERTQPVYFEPRVIVSPFRFTTVECGQGKVVTASPVTVRPDVSKQEVKQEPGYKAKERE